MREKTSQGLAARLRARLGRRLDPAPAGPAATPESRGLEPLDLEGCRVLVVEDSDVGRLVAGDVLAHMGATVDYAENGLAGAEKYLANPEGYDYIFMDVHMPVMDGYAATARIRQGAHPRARMVPIIAMTAGALGEGREQALAAGMDAYVSKPVEVAQIERALGGLGATGRPRP